MKLQPTENLLVLGAGSGVGRLVKLKNSGATVIAVARGQKNVAAKLKAQIL